MTIKSRSDDRPSNRCLVALTLISGLPPLLLGCDQQDQTGKAVQKTATQMTAMSAGVGPAPVSKLTGDGYNSVITTLKPVESQGLPDENAAALVLSARAQLGLALQPAAESARQERDSLNRELVIGSQLGAWIGANSAASARALFDPTAQIAEAQAAAAEKAKQADAVSKGKAQIDAKITDLLAQARTKAAEAKAEEDLYAGLKERAAKLTAIHAEPVIKEAAQHRRNADQLRTQGQQLEAEAAQLAPQSAEAQLQIDQFLNQKGNFEASATQLAQRGATARAETGAARAEATKVAETIDKALAELRDQRAGALAGAYADASQRLQTAAATAQRAGGADPAASKMTVGSAQQELGGLEWARAHGLESYRMLLDALVKAQPALPNAAAYAKESEEVAAQRKEALRAAKEAYEAAQSAFSAVRVKGEAKERLDRLASQVEKIAKYLSGESNDLDFTVPVPVPAVDDSTDAEPSTPTATAAPGTPAELLLAIDGFIAAAQSEDFGAIRPFLHVPPDMASLVDQMGVAATAQKKLDLALRQKFNAGIADMLKQAPGAGGAGGLGGMGAGGLDGQKLAGIKAADLSIAVTGEKASVTFPEAPRPAEFVLVGGAWLLDIGFDKMPPAQLEAVRAIIGPIGQAMEELAADVESGKFQTLQAATVGFLQKIQPLMGQIGGGGGGGGGGG